MFAVLPRLTLYSISFWFPEWLISFSCFSVSALLFENSRTSTGIALWWSRIFLLVGVLGPCVSDGNTRISGVPAIYKGTMCVLSFASWGLNPSSDFNRVKKKKKKSQSFGCGQQMRLHAGHSTRPMQGQTSAGPLITVSNKALTVASSGLETWICHPGELSTGRWPCLSTWPQLEFVKGHLGTTLNGLASYQGWFNTETLMNSLFHPESGHALAFKTLSSSPCQPF